MSYSYSPGDGIAALDPTEPDGDAEPLSNLDDAVKQIKAYLADTTSPGLAGALVALQDAVASLGSSVAGLSSRAAFVAYATGDVAWTAGGATVQIQFDQEESDPDGVFTPGTYKFKAPSAGIYMFVLTLRVDVIASSTPVGISYVAKLYKNGAPFAEASRGVGTITDGTTVSITRQMTLALNDEVTAHFSAGVASGSINGEITGGGPQETSFQGFKIA